VGNFNYIVSQYSLKLRIVVVTDKPDSSVYKRVRDMAIAFNFKPGDRINEVHLAKELSVSRTPLREAMQQLVSEKLLRWERNKGFFCRDLDEKEVLDLYEYRGLLEEQSIKLACARATQGQIQEMSDFLNEHKAQYIDVDCDRQVWIDQEFHQMIAASAANDELYNALLRVNQRIYFMRWIDMANIEGVFEPSHADLLAAIKSRDSVAAVALMGEHVGHRREQIVQSIRQAYGSIYTGNTPKLLPSESIE
jgi:DNA-binding GntR family transcriptional regulator